MAIVIKLKEVHLRSEGTGNGDRDFNGFVPERTRTFAIFLPSDNYHRDKPRMGRRLNTPIIGQKFRNKPEKV